MPAIVQVALTKQDLCFALKMAKSGMFSLQISTTQERVTIS